MDVTLFENVGSFKDGEVFEWKVPWRVLNHEYSTKRSDVFTLSRVPDFKFCLTLRPHQNGCLNSVLIKLSLHRIPVVKCDAGTSTENTDNILLDMDVRFILLKSDIVYKWSGVMKMNDKQVIADFPKVSTSSCLSVQCIITPSKQSDVIVSREKTGAEGTKHGLVHCLSSLVNNSNFSDVTLCVPGRKFRAHRCILASRSIVFSAMFNYDHKEKLENRIVITDIASEVIEQLLKYVYTDEIDKLTPQQYLALFAAADKYDIAGLRQKCAHHLKQNIPLDSFVPILIAADLHHENDLKEAAIQEFLKNPLPIINSDEWISCLKHHTELANSVVLRLAKK